jgi:transposase InsO family protein
MAKSLQVPSIEAFVVKNTSNLEQTWRRWKKRFQFYIGASGITDKHQKKCLLLHSAGTDVQDIYETLPGVGPNTEYNEVLNALDEYFKGKKNLPFERHVFRQAKQETSETIAEFVTRLKILGATCEYVDLDDAIKDQVVEACRSVELRKKLLKTEDLNLDKVQEIGRSFETVSHQSSQMSAMATGTSGSVSETVNLLQRSTSTAKKKGDPASKKQAYHSQGKTSAGKRVQPPNKSSTECQRCGYQEHKTKDRTCPALKATCRRCSRTGHFESVCRTKLVHVVLKDQKTHDVHADLESEDQETDEYDYVFMVNKSNVSPSCSVTINDVQCSMTIDTGSTVNCINLATFQRLQESWPECKLVSYPDKVFGYSGASLDVKGKFNAKVSAKGKTVPKVEFLVVDHDKVCNILSGELSQELNLIKLLNQITSIESDPRLYAGVGKLRDFELHIHTDPNVTPIIQKPRRIPYAFREKTEEKLEELVKADIIEQVEGVPSSWVSPIVVVPKPSGDVRVCVDMRRVNEAVVRERFQIPTVDETLMNLNESTVFSKLDLAMGYHQIVLDEESRSLTTFTTHCGVYRYKRLMFGISAAPEMYQHVIAQTLSKCEGVVNISDDILVHGRDMKQHDARLKKVLLTLVEAGLTLNQGKCRFRMKKLEFMGHVLSEHGIGPTEAKVIALQNATKPKDASQVKSFLGLAGFCSRYIRDFETRAEPLRILVRKNSTFLWGEEQDKAFEDLKRSLTTRPVLAYFNSNAKTRVVADASPVGLGAVLLQQQRDGSFKPVHFASKCLTDVERRYSQTEKEALGLVWACERFQLYLLGRDFELVTDHRPLQVIYGPRSKPSARIERWVLRLQPFKFVVKYIEGNKNIADPLSRMIELKLDNKSLSSEVGEQYIRCLALGAVPNTMSAKEVEQASSQDEEMRDLRKQIKTGDFPKGSPFAHVKSELAVVGYVVVRQGKLVIPKALRQRVLELAHKGHQGIVKTKARLREKVWWPSMSTECEAFVKKCHACQVVSPPNAPETPIPTAMPEGPWQDLAIDFLGEMPTGEYILVLVDYYSRYVVAKVYKSASVKNVIEMLEETIDVFGLPFTLKSDNGPQFVSQEFEEYMKSNGIELLHSTPRWPQANGEVERQNATLLKAMRAACVENKDWRKEMRVFLRAYNTTPHSTTHVSPAELMFKRTLRTELPTFRQTEDNPEMRDSVAKKQVQVQEQKAKRQASGIEVGDLVLLKQEKKSNKLSPTFHLQPGEIIEKKGTQVTVRMASGGEYKRNISHVKKYLTSVPQDSKGKVSEVPIKRSKRDTHLPSFLKDYECSRK